MPNKADSPTQALAAWIAQREADPISPGAIERAQHALLDWLGVTIAGTEEEVSKILTDEALADSGPGPCMVIGQNIQLAPSAAALVNGAASHALDYDDVNKRMRGHPSVAILPALLSAATKVQPTGKGFLEALVVGTETACLVGEMMGPEHYLRGFHNTATIGTIGAAAGTASLLGLSTDQTQAALGLAATQAAGLRSMFGSMAKPLHAGKAALNGYLSASWASAGMTAGKDCLESVAGLGATQSLDFSPLTVRSNRNRPFGIEENVFKYHAACYYTHSALFLLEGWRRRGEMVADQVQSISIELAPGSLAACNISEPQTGLEIKFSIRHLAAMAVLGIETDKIENYTSATAAQSDLVSLRCRIEATPREFESRTASRVTVKMKSGQSLTTEQDVGIPESNNAKQRQALEIKFRNLIASRTSNVVIEDIIEKVFGLDRASGVGDLLAAIAQQSKKEK